MCLAIPGKIISIDAKKQTAIVDYESEKREVSTQIMPDAAVGDYVLVQAKVIVLKIPEDDAKRAIEAVKEWKV